MTDRDILRAAYQRVREHSDDEVQGLLDELETVALQSDKAFGRIKQAVSQPVVVPLVSNDPTEIEHADRIFACDPDESGGYATDDPKHPTWHDRMCDVYDLREKGL